MATQNRLSGSNVLKTSIVIALFTLMAVPSYAGTIVGSKHDFSLSNSTGLNHFAGAFQLGPPGSFGVLIDEVCVFCHTPHGASQDAETNTLLWNRIGSPPTGYTYKPYTSGSMTNPAPDTAGATPTGISMMCMSCHDGVTSIAATSNANYPSNPTLLNAPGSGSQQVSIDPLFGLPDPGAIGNVFNGGSIGWGANIGNAIPGSGSTIDLSNDHPVSFEWPTGVADLYASPQDPSLRLFGASGKRIECATCHSVHDPTIEPFLAMSNAQSNMCRSCHIK